PTGAGHGPARDLSPVSIARAAPQWRRHAMHRLCFLRFDTGRVPKAMRLTIVGCGDAFGSGGRANTCFWIEAKASTIALDFGATSLVALKRMSLDPNRLDGIMLSHLHGHPSGAPSTAVRLHDGDKTLVYSGDTSWTDALVEIATGADLYITECYRFSGAPVAHLDFQTIDANRARFKAKRIMLTHMSVEVL